MSFFLLVGWIVCAIYTFVIAESKGHDGIPWGIGGFLLGPIALLAAVGLPDRKTYRLLREIAIAQGVKPRKIVTSEAGEEIKIIKTQKGIDKDDYIIQLLARETPGISNRISMANSKIDGSRATLRNTEGQTLFAYFDISSPNDKESMWMPENQ